MKKNLAPPKISKPLRLQPVEKVFVELPEQDDSLIIELQADKRSRKFPIPRLPENFMDPQKIGI